jgi:hypothetical protein
MQGALYLPHQGEFCDVTTKSYVLLATNPGSRLARSMSSGSGNIVDAILIFMFSTYEVLAVN